MVAEVGGAGSRPAAVQLFIPSTSLILELLKLDDARNLAILMEVGEGASCRPRNGEMWMLQFG